MLALWIVGPSAKGSVKGCLNVRIKRYQSPPGRFETHNTEFNDICESQVNTKACKTIELMYGIPAPPASNPSIISTDSSTVGNPAVTKVTKAGYIIV